MIEQSELSNAEPPVAVLHVLGSAAREATGVARVVETLARRLDQGSYAVHVCFLSRPGPLLPRLAASCASAVAVNWNASFTDIGGVLRFARALRRTRYAIVHQHHGGRAVSALVRALTPAKLVVHVHGRIVEPDTASLVARQTQLANLVIANSRATAALSSHARTQVVYTGVELGAEPAFTRNLPPLIGAAGRLVPVKGVAYLLEAFCTLRARLPQLRLEIAGDGRELVPLQRKATELRISDGVQFLGWVDDLAPVFGRWHLFVLPSLEESFGVAALEAMAAGLPVVASNVGGVPELIGDAGILVPAANSDALTAGIASVLEDSQLRIRLAKAAYERARDEFSARQMCNSIAAIYEDLLVT